MTQRPGKRMTLPQAPVNTAAPDSGHVRGPWSRRPGRNHLPGVTTSPRSIPRNRTRSVFDRYREFK
jgi:hypothetical protein